MMENTFRSAVFGGFNRQDVMEYISKTAQEHRECLEQLEKENEDLRADQAAKSGLADEMEQLRRERETVAQELAEERTAKEQYRSQLEEVSAKIQRMERFQQEAEEYSGVKDHIAEIELEARRRADAMLAEAQSQADRLTAEAHQRAEEIRRAAREQLQELSVQYGETMKTLQTVVAHVSGELRRMDVAVGQLPLAFDKVRAELEKLNEQSK